jgi:5-hydroxyisourate hydrolase
VSGISTHILDTAQGRPATGVTVALSRADAEGSWQLLSTSKTDDDGRCRQLMPESAVLAAGAYRIRFETAAYYEAHSLNGLYPYVEINFTVRAADEHLHIPLLLTANGYTTYRGT